MNLRFLGEYFIENDIDPLIGVACNDVTLDKGSN